MQSIQSDENLNQIEDVEPQSRNTSKGQKIAVIFLAFFAVLVFVLWSIQLRQSIMGPFKTAEPDASQEAGTGVCTGPDCQKDLAAAQREQDTDNDGLSDWDELNIYKTSPYLEDSDSDGFSDQDEVSTGNDPNCPEGRDCYGASQPAEEADNNISVDDVTADINFLDQDEAMQNILAGGSDVKTLRQMLIAAGMNEGLLSQISDEDLMKSYQETLGQ